MQVGLLLGLYELLQLDEIFFDEVRACRKMASIDVGFLDLVTSQVLKFRTVNIGQCWIP